MGSPCPYQHPTVWPAKNWSHSTPYSFPEHPLKLPNYQVLWARRLNILPQMYLPPLPSPPITFLPGEAPFSLQASILMYVVARELFLRRLPDHTTPRLRPPHCAQVSLYAFVSIQGTPLS